MLDLADIPVGITNDKQLKTLVEKVAPSLSNSNQNSVKF